MKPTRPRLMPKSGTWFDGALPGGRQHGAVAAGTTVSENGAVTMARAAPPVGIASGAFSRTWTIKPRAASQSATDQASPLGLVVPGLVENAHRLTSHIVVMPLPRETPCSDKNPPSYTAIPPAAQETAAGKTPSGGRGGASPSPDYPHQGAALDLA